MYSPGPLRALPLPPAAASAIRLCTCRARAFTVSAAAILVAMMTTSSNLPSTARYPHTIDYMPVDQIIRLQPEVASQVTRIEYVGSRYHYAPVAINNYCLFFVNCDLSLFN